LRATKVFLYFSSAPVVPESIDQDQYKSLIEYRDRLRSEGVIFEYSSIGEFRDLVQRHLSSFMASIINYRAQIVSDPENKLLPIFSEATKIMKALCRHQLFLDGGKSFREFWEKGDAVIELLKRLPSALAD